MTAAIDTLSEDHRRECEARFWLRKGYSTPTLVDQLMTTIGKHRGAAAADVLRNEMRRQWRRRAEWMEQQ